ncbi:class I SAM-dependent methyltransferase [Shewanella yunxiaonensis]|uniref:Class I SAM-dependent methyltransferase n=1 Tax=Shewanella yunxiaonensis TaxID=2829809 RepID=A0ABX7YWM2_9GAMM|nr:class I SAM-dependent methyltransferase [Shewanella yunxiaonensis]QUN07217.1 class I SAM-dependent methyltransferase [Shewanella yunxiaonensis]
MSKDYFSHKAHIYEQDNNRVDNVGNIADAIRRQVALSDEMHLVDFGSGTGLLLERIAPNVRKITAVDISASMNQQLAEKQANLPCELEMIQANLEQTDIDGQFDGIISSMTMHHIQNIDAMFSKFERMVHPGGFIAIADLDKEDGSFHTDDTGVFHFGFEHEEIAAAARRAGFEQVQVINASVARKPYGDYPVFLLTGFRKS